MGSGDPVGDDHGAATQLPVADRRDCVTSAIDVRGTGDHSFMSSTARRSPPPRGAVLPPAHGREPFERAPVPSERLLLESIASGELDVHLSAIVRAIDARLHLLHTMESIDALAELVVGDHVRINHHARPRYLQGLRATVIDVDAQAATISLERPIGRFTSGTIRCPPLVLDRLGPRIG